MPISDNIKKLRQIFDVTQDELGEIAGVTGNAVSQWENGRSEPRMGAIERMAACYQISKSHLIEDGGMDQIDPVTKKPKGSSYMPAGAMPVVASSSVSRMHTAFCSYQESTMDSGRSFTPQPKASARATAIWMAL